MVRAQKPAAMNMPMVFDLEQDMIRIFWITLRYDLRPKYDPVF